MSRLDACYSSKSDEWSTPKELFDELNEEFGFTLDPCSTGDNHLCDKYYTIHEDGLEQSWGGVREYFAIHHIARYPNGAKKHFMKVKIQTHL